MAACDKRRCGVPSVGFVALVCDVVLYFDTARLSWVRRSSAKTLCVCALCSLTRHVFLDCVAGIGDCAVAGRASG